MSHIVISWKVKLYTMQLHAQLDKQLSVSAVIISSFWKYSSKNQYNTKIEQSKIMWFIYIYIYISLSYEFIPSLCPYAIFSNSSNNMVWKAIFKNHSKLYLSYRMFSSRALPINALQSSGKHIPFPAVIAHLYSWVQTRVFAIPFWQLD